MDRPQPRPGRARERDRVTESREHGQPGAQSRDARVAEIEQRIGKLEARPKSGWDILAIFIPLVQGLLLAAVGYFLTDSVNRALKERELDLSNAKEMRELLLKMNAPGITATDAEATALTLTAFGRYAVGPLVNLLQEESLQNIAAERALRALGATEQARVCAAILPILHNRAQMYSVQALASGVRLSGSLSCRDTAADLEELRSRVAPGTLEEGLPKLRELVALPGPTKDDLRDLRSDLERTQRALGR